MAVHLIIAGHGRRKNGTFDSGATGVITKGEHRYVKEDLFPHMKKYADDTLIFFDEYNVFSHGNLVSLVNKYNADTVTEVHYDAFNGKAQGGHVIIHQDYSPDAMDLRLRDAIKSMVGTRFTFRGQAGISGRNNLGNLNIARRNGITYRLIELGFGDNPRDAGIMVNRVDEYAKKLVEAIKGSKVSGTPSTPSKPAPSKPKPKPSTGNSVAGAKLVKNENAFFLATENIKVRNAPSVSATNTGTLPKGSSINYFKVYEGNGYRWLQYTGNSGNTLYVPYRESGSGKTQWGTFHSTRPSGGSSKPAPKKTASKTAKAGDTVTAKALYGTAQSTKNVRSSNIKGYVADIDNSRRNPIRLRNKKGGYYLGFTRQQDLV